MMDDKKEAEAREAIDSSLHHQAEALRATVEDKPDAAKHNENVAAQDLEDARDILHHGESK
jgi:hypothetical protein